MIDREGARRRLADTPDGLALQRVSDAYTLRAPCTPVLALLHSRRLIRPAAGGWRITRAGRDVLNGRTST